MARKNKRGRNILLIVIILVLIAAILLNIFKEQEMLPSPEQGKNMEISILVQGLSPIQELEVYQGYPVYYTLFTNYSAYLYDVRVSNLEYKNDNLGSFKAQILDNSKRVLSEVSFEPNFLILSDPPTETNTDIIDLYFPHTGEEKYLKIYWNSREMLFVEIASLLCNYNSKCEVFENYLSCLDCSEIEEDEICNSISGDNFCDLDCYKDSDCGTCEDGIKNGNEEGVDCGGIACKACSEEGIVGEEIIDEELYSADIERQIPPDFEDMS